MTAFYKMFIMATDIIWNGNRDVLWENMFWFSVSHLFLPLEVWKLVEAFLPEMTGNKVLFYHHTAQKMDFHVTQKTKVNCMDQQRKLHKNGILCFQKRLVVSETFVDCVIGWWIILNQLNQELQSLYFLFKMIKSIKAFQRKSFLKNSDQLI